MRRRHGLRRGWLLSACGGLNTKETKDTKEESNGVRWHGNQRIDPHYLTAVGCGSAHLCAATDAIGRVSMYNGDRWTSLRRIDGTHPLISVSCTGSSLCAALDQQGGVLIYRNGHWSARHAEFTVALGSHLAFSKVSCGSANRCVAESSDGAVGTITGSAGCDPQASWLT